MKVTKNILMPLLVGAVTFSCDKNDLSEVAPNNVLTAESISNAVSTLIYNETFDGTTVWADQYTQYHVNQPHSFQVQNNPYGTTKVGRFELRDTDAHQSGGTRSEVLFPEQANLHRWYSYNVYFPSADYAYDSAREIISQWHQGGGASPSIAFEIIADKFQVVIPSGATSTGVSEKIPLVGVPKNKWNQLVFHINHSSGSDGLLEIWLNGSKILTRRGANMYPLSSHSRPRWKMGIYKWKWNDSNTTDTKKRVLYYDNVRVGSENAIMSDMTSSTVSSTEPTITEPTTGTTEPTPTTTEPTTSTSNGITSFTLVNASADKDVMNVTNGATLNLSSIGVYKFNVRANTSPTTVGSVKFELSGPQTRTYVDNTFPYAVQGDDGSGNYYFGKWKLPDAAGTYTLKSTVYSGSNAGGTAGATTTITFTVK